MAGGPRAPSIVYPDALRTRALFGARVRYQSQIGGVLAAILPLAAPLIPRPEIHLDYEPWIRNMVESDDREEEQQIHTAEIQRLQRPGRLTRNSSSRRYVRMIDITEGQREALRATSLDLSLSNGETI